MKNYSFAYIVVAIFTTATALAQFPSDKFRDVNAAGPYPIYIIVQPGTLGLGFNDYTNFSKLYADNTNSVSRKNLWGGEASVGFVINEGKLFNFYIEPLCFRYLTRSQKSSDEAERMTYIYQTASLRGGIRVNIFFPVTLHILGGPIYYYQQVVKIDRSSTKNLPAIRYYDKSGLFVNEKFYNNPRKLSGFDFKIRLNIIDAISSSGGLGFYLETYHSFIYKQRIPAQQFGLAPALPGDSEINEWNHSFSFGAVIPLALRVKRLFPRTFKPKRYEFTK